MPKLSQELLVCKWSELLPSTVALSVHLHISCLVAVCHTKSYFVLRTIFHRNIKKYKLFYFPEVLIGEKYLCRATEMNKTLSYNINFKCKWILLKEILSSKLCSSWNKTVHKFFICLDFQTHILVMVVFKRIVRCLIHSQSIAIHLK